MCLKGRILVLRPCLAVQMNLMVDSGLIILHFSPLLRLKIQQQLQLKRNCDVGFGKFDQVPQALDWWEKTKLKLVESNHQFSLSISEFTGHGKGMTQHCRNCGLWLCYRRSRNKIVPLQFNQSQRALLTLIAAAGGYIQLLIGLTIELKTCAIKP